MADMWKKQCNVFVSSRGDEILAAFSGREWPIAFDAILWRRKGSVSAGVTVEMFNDSIQMLATLPTLLPCWRYDGNYEENIFWKNMVFDFAYVRRWLIRRRIHRRRTYLTGEMVLTLFFGILRRNWSWWLLFQPVLRRGRRQNCLAVTVRMWFPLWLCDCWLDDEGAVAWDGLKLSAVGLFSVVALSILCAELQATDRVAWYGDILGCRTIVTVLMIWNSSNPANDRNIVKPWRGDVVLFGILAAWRRENARLYVKLLSGQTIISVMFLMCRGYVQQTGVALSETWLTYSHS
jgi:hypothetical protein